MNQEKEQKILAELKKNFIYDLKHGIANLLRKSSVDVKMKLSELLQTSDLNELAEAKNFVQQSTEVMATDIVNQLIETVEKY